MKIIKVNIPFLEKEIECYVAKSEFNYSTNLGQITLSFLDKNIEHGFEVPRELIISITKDLYWRIANENM